MDTKRIVSILLATYNSSRYLGDQIDSILNQTISEWKLFVRDDGSTDNTLDLIADYCEKFPDRIILLNDSKGALRSYYNFVELLTSVESDYYMFCDHDDVWLPNKMELCMDQMFRLEKVHPDMPVIVHSDMKVVDQDLNTLSDSFWKYSRLMPDRCSFWDLVCCNCVNGCTMLINQKAKEVSLPNVPYCLMHDALVAQSVAASDGIIYALRVPLVLYRQHINNVIGAADVKKRFFLERSRNLIATISDNVGVWRRAVHIKRLSLLAFLLHKAKISYLRYRLL